MKKVIVILLAAALLLSVVGCKKAENKKLTVAMSPDFAPMEFVDTSKSGQEQYVGFDVTLANFLADELGMELEIKPMSFDACMTAVQLGSVDMAISGFSWKPDRAENFLLSDYYIAGDNETQQSVITVKAKENTCKTQADFSGWKVGAQASSLQEQLVKDELIPAGAELVVYKSIDDAVLALQTGKIDALAVAHGNGGEQRDPAEQEQHRDAGEGEQGPREGHGCRGLRRLVRGRQGSCGHPHRGGREL